MFPGPTPETDAMQASSKHSTSPNNELYLRCLYWFAHLKHFTEYYYNPTDTKHSAEQQVSIALYNVYLAISIAFLTHAHAHGYCCADSTLPNIGRDCQRLNAGSETNSRCCTLAPKHNLDLPSCYITYHCASKVKSDGHLFFGGCAALNLIGRAVSASTKYKNGRVPT